MRLSETPEVAISSGQRVSVVDATAMLNNLRDAEVARYAVYHELAEVKAAVQSAVMWNVVYSPLLYGPVVPVIRGNPWGLDQGAFDDLGTHEQAI